MLTLSVRRLRAWRPGETDDMLFTINEEFTKPEAVGRHIESAMKNDYFPE